MSFSRCIAPVALLGFVASLAWSGTARAQWSSDTSINLWVGDGNGDQVLPKIAPTSDGGCYISWNDNGRSSIRFDTWTWSGTAWANAGQFQPGARWRHAMAYDSVRNRTVVFGGFGFADEYTDTWEWNNVAWTQVDVSGPVARIYSAMAFDAARGVVVLFGGSDDAGAFLGDTWTYDGTAWTQLSPVTSPNARRAHSLAYDSLRQVIVLFGGEGGGGKQADTWEWNGTTWTQVVTANAPSARSEHATAFDPVSNKVLLFGGSNTGNVVQNDTWLYDGVDWVVQAPATVPSARSGHAMANSFTAGGVRTVIYGGNTGTFYTQGMFEWNGTNWASKSSGPSARTNSAMAYDSAAARTVLFGGVEVGGHDVRLQRLSAKGVEQWPHKGVLIVDRSASAVSDYGLIADADGNAVIAFFDDRFATGKVTVQKVSPSGTLLWNGTLGVQVGDGSSLGTPPTLALLSDGGYGIIWNGLTAPTQTKIQKLDTNGTALWTTVSQGDPVIGTPRPFQTSDVQAADAGGLIVLFVRCSGATCTTSAKHLYAQKYDSTGAGVWGGGLPIAIYTASGLTNGYFPRFLPDGAGGGVFGWYEGGLNRDAFIQHVLADGTQKFVSPIANTGATPGRIRVGAGLAYNPATDEYYLASPETDSASQSQNSVFVQKYDGDGARLWTETGVSVLPATNTTQPSFVQAQLMGDGVAVYYMKTTAATTRVIAGARVAADLSIVWDVLPASNGGEEKSRLTSAVSACGEHILAFGNGSIGGSDIRAQNVRLDGTFGNPPPLLGDLDCDGVVDTPDIQPFIQALLSPAGYAFLHPCCDINNADMNVDLSIDGLDIADFTTALLNP